MVSKFVRRLLAAAGLFWLVITIIFGLMRAAPGDPSDFLVPPGASVEDVNRLRSDLGLDRPLAVQYARWALDVARGELGESFTSRRPVIEVLAQAAPVSIGLGAVSLFLTFLIGVPVGMIQAANLNRPADRITTVITTTVYAAPSFWLALALVAIFTYGASRLGLPAALRLPAFGLTTPGADLSGFAAFADLIRHSILPVATLTAVGAAGIARYTRNGVAEILPRDYIRTARAKGASGARIYLHHILRDLAPQLVVLFALSLPGLVAGSVFVESIFAWPGLGQTMLAAIAARDYPVVMGASVFYAAAVLLANLAADLLLPVLDPRRRNRA